MVFISSSYVFDGEKGNYTELDIPNSKTKYAMSKIQAEKQVLKLNNAIIVRTELLYGYDEEINKIKIGTNVLESNLTVGYPDILRSPVYIDDIPRVIKTLIKNQNIGIFHIAGPRKIRWIDFMKKLSKIIDLDDRISIVDNSNWILKPLQDSSLDISKINSLGITTTSFEAALSELNEISKKSIGIRNLSKSNNGL